MFSTSKVKSVIDFVRKNDRTRTERAWIHAVASKVIRRRPDLRNELLEVLEIENTPSDPLEKTVNPLGELSIGELGVCYEALKATMDTASRKNCGQYFTPDDTALFMAHQSRKFPHGTWLDPCCGVGNLAWHLASVQKDPGVFVRDNLIMIDQDLTALRTAAALICADFLPPEDGEAVRSFSSRAHHRNFLSPHSLPEHDFAILNPPYVRFDSRAETRSHCTPVAPSQMFHPTLNSFDTATTGDLFSLFLERVAKNAQGFIAVTPASYLSVARFQPVRDMLENECSGGKVFVFDNVPDTLFRGYKHGSNNTSKTNFVRAAITVTTPKENTWETTPILRWKAVDRKSMFNQAPQLLTERKIGPNGEWVKLLPGLSTAWDKLCSWQRSLSDMVVRETTNCTLQVATTPRYFISATFMKLDRKSKLTLSFASDEDRDLCALVLNSSIPYLWWRALDGGVTLTRKVLMSVPIPFKKELNTPSQTVVPSTLVTELANQIRCAEKKRMTTKLNAGRINQNVKHDHSLVQSLNETVLPGVSPANLALLYSNNMFPLEKFGHTMFQRQPRPRSVEELSWDKSIQ